MFNVALVDCGSSRVGDIASILSDQECRVQRIFLAHANGFDFISSQAVVISGGPHLFTDAESSTCLIQQFEFLDLLPLPVFGICLGHQALGIRSGVKAYRGEERRTEELIRTIVDHELFHDLPPEFSMKVDHCEGIPLPEGFDKLASSEFYPVEIMASRRLPHFGVQFHPEISGEPGRIIIRNFCSIAKGVQQ